MFKLIVILFLLTSCEVSRTEAPVLHNLNAAYPFFDIHVSGFRVANQDSNEPGATAIDNQNAKIITVSEKNVMLMALDTARFVVNTPEFAALMKSQIYYAANTVSGPNGSVQQGTPYPDNNRLLQVIQNRMASVEIRKEQISTSAFAIGQLPITSSGQLFNAYVAADNDPLNHGEFFIAFNNRQKWDDVAFFQDDGFVAGVVFHELLHNMGFSHDEPLDVSKDTVYILQTVLMDVFNTASWQAKYRTPLKEFRPFYPRLYNSFLHSSTVPTRSFAAHNHDHHDEHIHEVRSMDSDNLSRAFEKAQIFYSRDGNKIQCVYDEESKSYVMRIL